MDPLSDVVGMLRPSDCVAAGFDAGGEWSIRFDRHEGLKCNAVVKGSCYISVDGRRPELLTEGDCAILPHGLPFVMASKPVRSGMNAAVIYAPVPHGGTVTYGAGGAFFMTGSRFRLSGPPAATLLKTLPDLLVIRSSSEQNGIIWAIERIAEELREARLGSHLSITHLSHFLLLQVFRCHLSQNDRSDDGWLAALTDERLAQAVSAFHADPARNWSVQSLAEVAGMARTSFAVLFRDKTGQTPIEYLSQWRMPLAAQQMRETDASLSQIALDIGYASESAFIAAFKRIVGEPPRSYARRQGV